MAEKYYAMMFLNEVSGVTVESELLNCCQENHGDLVVCRISKQDFERFGYNDIPAKNLGRRYNVSIVESVVLEKAS